MGRMATRRTPSSSAAIAAATGRQNKTDDSGGRKRSPVKATGRTKVTKEKEKKKKKTKTMTTDKSTREDRNRLLMRRISPKTSGKKIAAAGVLGSVASALSNSSRKNRSNNKGLIRMSNFATSRKTNPCRTSLVKQVTGNGNVVNTSKASHKKKTPSASSPGANSRRKPNTQQVPAPSSPSPSSSNAVVCKSSGPVSSILANTSISKPASLCYHFPYF